MSDISKFLKFKIVTIERSKINNAPYNPRTIDDRARKELKANLKRVGLIEPLIWNKTTGNLLSGHQRISILDDLEGSQNYSMVISQVEMDLKTEKEQNIFLNNPSAQGDFDFTALGKIMKDIKLEYTGFDEADLSAIGVSMDTEGLSMNTQENDTVIALQEMSATERIEDDIEHDQKKAEIRDIKGAALEKARNEDPGLTYIVITFSTRDEKNKLLKKLGFEDDEKYVKGEILQRLIK